VWIDGEVLGKPHDAEDATRMLRLLSGHTHQVITGVSITTRERQHCFSVVSHVTFAPLTDAEIAYYIEHYRPFDKAGAYGIQEWIGYIGVTRLEGSYFNVMGLPVQRLYQELLKF
jgi:septum formation protein